MPFPAPNRTPISRCVRIKTVREQDGRRAQVVILIVIVALWMPQDIVRPARDGQNYCLVPFNLTIVARSDGDQHVGLAGGITLSRHRRSLYRRSRAGDAQIDRQVAGAIAEAADGNVPVSSAIRSYMLASVARVDCRRHRRRGD